MKEVMKDHDFNITLRIITISIFISFLMINVISCERERISKTTSLEELKKTGMNVLGRLNYGQ